MRKVSEKLKNRFRKKGHCDWGLIRFYFWGANISNDTQQVGDQQQVLDRKVASTWEEHFSDHITIRKKFRRVVGSSEKGWLHIESKTENFSEMNAPGPRLLSNARHAGGGIVLCRGHS